MSRDAMTDLKPCPFCGGKPYDCQHLTYSNWGVGCSCGARGPTFNAGYRPMRDAEIRAHDDAIAAWNTRAALAAEQPQPEAQPVAVVTECEACFTPDVCQLRGKCDHYSTDWLRVAPPPSAPAPSEAEVAAAMASLYRAMEPAAWPSEDEVTDALRAAAAARNTNPA